MVEKHIPPELADKPIKIPGNPFWNVFKRFGRDEVIAMFINVIGTAIISFFMTTPIILSIAGPIIEKIGFFPAHIKEALDIYKTTPENKRKSRGFYLKKAFKGGFTSLIEDVLIHDPLYIIIMYAGIKLYSQTPVWILSATSFVIAVIIVSGIEVGFREFQYWLFQKKLAQLGFRKESYYEARFFIHAKKSSTEVLKCMKKKFSLDISYDLKYNDTYYETNLGEYSDRIPKFRLRKRTNSEKRKNKFIQTVQIIYTKAYESTSNKYDQFRYFPIKKEKYYFILKQPMPKTFTDIKNIHIKKYSKTICNKKTAKSVKFHRRVVHNRDLLVSADEIKNGVFLIEIKTHKNLKLMLEAMRLVMKEFPVIQTTKGKFEFNE